MRILITGATGFVGGHLVDLLGSQADAELHGTTRSFDQVPAHLGGKIQLHACDLQSTAAVEAVLRAVGPERIYHLAGYASPSGSMREADKAWTGNLEVTRALYDAIRAWGGRARVLFVGSGLIYGETNGQTFTEESPLFPSTPYAASKAAADLMSYQYTCYPGLEIVRVRPFNHTGPRQSTDYAVPRWARQIAAIERGRQPPILTTGNLNASRDLTDVRDVVQAYRLLMDKGRTGEAYNVASGWMRSMQEVLDRLLSLTKVRVEVRSEAGPSPAFRHARADFSKLQRETGWSPHIGIDQTLQVILDYWRSMEIQTDRSIEPS